MKKVLITVLLFVLFLASGGFFVYDYIRQSVRDFSFDEIFREPDVTSKVPSVAGQRITYKSSTIWYDYFFSTPEAVRLIENSTGASASELSNVNLCRKYTSGGYYDTDMRPLGLFVVNGSVLYPLHVSTTLNALFSISEDNTVTIGDPIIVPDQRLSLQAGPFLIRDGVKSEFDIANDEGERRIVVAVLTNGTLVFLVLYDGRSVYLGPYLKDVPELVSRIADAEGFKIRNAMNLDGGTASAFGNGGTVLHEFKNVGSILCIK